MICPDVSVVCVKPVEDNAVYNRKVAELAALNAEIEELNAAFFQAVRVTVDLPFGDPVGDKALRKAEALEHDLEERQTEYTVLMSELRPMIARRFPSVAEMTLTEEAFKAGGDVD